MRQERILLGLVVAVDLIDEDDRAALVALAPHLRRLQQLLQLFHAGEDGADRFEVVARAEADDVGEGRLARARRAPQDQRAEVVRLDGPAQRLAGAEHLVLAEDLLERARPDPIGQGRVRARSVGHGRRGREEQPRGIIP